MLFEEDQVRGLLRGTLAMQYEFFKSMQLLSGAMVFFLMLYIFTLGAIVFNFIVIPKIEKRIGVKMIFDDPCLQIYPFAKWYRKQIEVSFGIFMAMIEVQKVGNFGKKNIIHKIPYTVKNAPLYEKVLSWMTLLVYTLLLVMMAIFTVSLVWQGLAS